MLRIEICRFWVVHLKGGYAEFSVEISFKMGPAGPPRIPGWSPGRVLSPTPRAYDHFSSIWGYDNPPPIDHSKQPHLPHVDILEKDPFLKCATKKTPPMSAMQKATIRAMREMVGEAKRKKYVWPQTSISLLNGINDCFMGSHGDGETSNTMSGKKFCFEPP